MKDLAQHTRLSPQARVQNLLEFRQSLDRNEEAASQLSRWNMKFDDQLVDIPARVLSTQNILQGMKVLWVHSVSGITVSRERTRSFLGNSTSKVTKWC